MDYLNKSVVTIHPPQKPVSGVLKLPGSKSITNRALLLAALAQGTSRLSGALASDDTKHMSNALRAMGVDVCADVDSEFLVKGKGFLEAPESPLFLGNAGTATRFLTAAVSSQKGYFVVDGDEHMRKRPIQPLVEALQSLGIEISTETGCPPVEIQGYGGFKTSEVKIDGGLSSQYISALLMAAPMHSEAFTLTLTGTDIGARGYIEITLEVMHAFGATVACPEIGVWRIEPTGYRAVDEYLIEPDASAATYLWAVAKLTGGNIDLGIRPKEMIQPDAKAWDYIDSWPHLPAEINGSQIQDAIPTLAAISAFNEAPVRFVGIENLRVKECDRVAACCNELNRIRPGLAEEIGDDILVHADPSLRGQTVEAGIETYVDHRIAMAFSLPGLLINGISILDPGCVAKTYPNYWKDLATLGIQLS